MEINKEGNGNEILQMRSKTNPLDLCWDATFSIMEKWLNSLKKSSYKKTIPLVKKRDYYRV